MSPDPAEGCVGTRCPACGAGLAVTYLLSRWNPFRFLCPRCGAALAYRNATKWILFALGIGGLLVYGANRMESAGVMSENAAYVLGLALVASVSIVSTVVCHRRGRIALCLADAGSMQRARNYNYVYGIVLPAAAVLFGGLFCVLMSTKWSQCADPSIEAKLQAVVDSANSAEATQEESAATVNRLVDAILAGDTFHRAQCLFLFEIGAGIALLALWILVGGWLATRNKALPEASPGDDAAPRPPPAA